MSRARLTRAVEFPAGHRYVLPDESEEASRERFGKSATPHGHLWRCEVTVAGEIDERTGMVVDLAELD
ncbi:MAG: 6-carboxytetrahydropterin synthase, partial [Gemmatimonadota bacterium]